MSTKTLRKRIALVAVSALGFGLVSAAPSSAAAITNITISQVAAPSDASLFIATATGSANALDYKIYTNNASVPVTDLRGAITGLPANDAVIQLALGTVATLQATAAAAADVATSTVTASATPVAFVAGSALTALTATAAGTSYVAFASTAVDGTTALTNARRINATAQPHATITVYRTVSTASISSTQLTSSAVGPNGMAGTWRIRYNTSATTDTVNPKARITSVPVGSRILNTNPLNGYYAVNASSITDLAPANIALVNGSAAYRTAAGTALAQVAANSSKQADTWFSM
jgi:trimeric autotransporter adhesin